MNERDELRGTLANTICNASNYPRRATPYLLGEDMSPVLDKTADAILAAGYRRPRTITTVEELNALPGSTVVKDELGQVFEKQESGQWHDGPHDWLAFDGKFWDVDAIHTPATVLYEARHARETQA